MSHTDDGLTHELVLLTATASNGWMDDAACKGRMQLFFETPGERPERRARREARARKVCAGCPVLAECRQTARRNGENGFWGGESEEERALAGYPPRSISRRSVQAAANEGLLVSSPPVSAAQAS